MATRRGGGPSYDNVGRSGTLYDDASHACGASSDDTAVYSDATAVRLANNEDGVFGFESSSDAIAYDIPGSAAGAVYDVATPRGGATAGVGTARLYDTATEGARAAHGTAISANPAYDMATRGASRDATAVPGAPAYDTATPGASHYATAMPGAPAYDTATPTPGRSTYDSADRVVGYDNADPAGDGTYEDPVGLPPEDLYDSPDSDSIYYATPGGPSRRPENLYLNPVFVLTPREARVRYLAPMTAKHATPFDDAAAIHEETDTDKLVKAKERRRWGGLCWRRLAAALILVLLAGGLGLGLGLRSSAAPSTAPSREGNVDLGAEANVSTTAATTMMTTATATTATATATTMATTMATTKCLHNKHFVKLTLTSYMTSLGP